MIDFRKYVTHVRICKFNIEMHNLKMLQTSKLYSSVHTKKSDIKLMNV